MCATQCKSIGFQKREAVVGVPYFIPYYFLHSSVVSTPDNSPRWRAIEQPDLGSNPSPGAELITASTLSTRNWT